MSGDTESLYNAAVDFLAYGKFYKDTGQGKDQLADSLGKLHVELAIFEIENELEVPEIFEAQISEIRTPDRTA